MIEIRDLSYSYDGKSEPANNNVPANANVPANDNLPTGAAGNCAQEINNVSANKNLPASANLPTDPGCNFVLKNINLSVAPGEKIGIVGESGSGKSTLIKLISGLYKVQSGTLNVNGSVAVVMQSLNLFPLTIRENITCGHQIPEEKIWQAVKIAQLEEWIKSLPQGLDTFAGVRGGNFSGGQTQRISIARAIAKDADILILDEATSALDNETATQLMRALDGWWHEKTVISIAHRAEALQFCGKIYKMENGGLTLC